MSTGTAKTKWILEFQDEITSELKSVHAEIEKLRAEMVETDEEVKESTESIKAFRDGYADLKGGINTGDLDQIRDGWRGVATGIQGATKAGLAFIGTPIGMAVTALAGIALATREWARYNEEATAANLITQQITRLSGDQLDNARVRAKALEETFGVDFQRILELAKNNVRAFDITFDEALDNIQDGLVRGGNVNDEYLDSIREYPRLFAEAGFSMGEFQRIVNTGIDEGIYSDKLPDAIKEFNISMREQTSSTREALENAFGKSFTDDILGGITDGTISPRDALIAISEEAKTTQLNAQQSAQLTADVFRGAGEDVGGLKVLLDGVNTALLQEAEALTPLQQNLLNVSEATQELEAAQNRALKSENYAYMANQASLAWTKVKTVWYDAINEITTIGSQWLDTYTVELVTLITTVRGLPAQFKLAFTEIKDEAADVVATFGNLSGIAGKLFTLDFKGAYEDAKQFKEDLEKEVDDVATVAGNAVGRAGILNQNVREKVRDEIQQQREGAAEAAGLTTPEGSASGGYTGGTGNAAAGGQSTPTTGTSGVSGGSGRTITMHLDITNNFKIADGAAAEIENIADKVVSMITDRLRDNTIALG